jgi:hypothetical protein
MSGQRPLVTRARGRRVAVAAMTALAIIGGGALAVAHAGPPATGGKRHNLYIKPSPGVGSALFEVTLPGTTFVSYSRCYDVRGSDWQPTGFKVDNGATIVASTYDAPGCPSMPASFRGKSNPKTGPGRDGSADWRWDLTTEF